MNRIGLAVILAMVFSFGHLTLAQQTQPTPQPARPTHSQTAQHKKKGLKLKVTGHSVGLSWVQSVVPAGATCTGGGSPAITANNVYRATATGQEGTTPYVSLTTPSVAYTDTAVTPGQTLFYQVTAVNCAGESGKSNEVSAVIPNPQVPNAPVQNPPTVQ